MNTLTHPVLNTSAAQRCIVNNSRTDIACLPCLPCVCCGIPLQQCTWSDIQLLLQAHRAFPLELQVYATQAARDAHVAESHSVCEFCNITFFSGEELWEHIHSRHFTCQLCLRQGHYSHFAGPQELTDHLRCAAFTKRGSEPTRPILAYFNIYSSSRCCCTCRKASTGLCCM